MCRSICHISQALEKRKLPKSHSPNMGLEFLPALLSQDNLDFANVWCFDEII